MQNKPKLLDHERRFAPWQVIGDQ
jgi:hypothetical protein